MPPRRQAKRNRVQTHEERGSSEDEGYRDKPMTKKVKRVRGKRENLANFLSMPLDVVYEVFFCLEPIDLLNLARTSKDLRRLLMSRDSSHVWKTVITQAEGTPDCPGYMTPPELVNLLYCSVCHECGKGPCEKIYWECKARYCNRCRSNVSITYKQYHDKDFSIHHKLNAPNVPSPLKYIPVYVIIPLVETVPVELDTVANWKDITIREQDLQTVERDLALLQNEDEIYAYIKRKTAEMETVREDTEMFICWMENQEQFRIEKKKKLQEERLEAIKEKLTGLGYGPWIQEIASSHIFKVFDTIIQPKPLTDRIWNNIQADIVEITERLKQEILEREAKELMEARLRILDRAVFNMRPRRRNQLSLRDIALHVPGVKDVMSLPRDQEVTLDSFKFLRTTLPEFEVRWKADARRYLCAKARADLGFDVEDPLALAVGSVFACRFCNKGFSWPNILAHACHDRAAPPPDADDYTKLICRLTDYTPAWKASDYRVLGKPLKAIIKAHGLDFMTATMEEMDQSPIRMTCPEHNKPWAVSIMNWRAMLEHFLTEKCESDQWQVVDEAQTRAAEYPEEFVREREDDREQRAWTCVHCPGFGQTLCTHYVLVHHVREDHGIENPTFDEDYVHSSPYSWTGATLVRLLDEKMKGQWKVRQYDSNTAAYYPLS